jgi:lysophospholipid acyltransferase (LPLAT)-like uncharacterized protein
MSEIEPSLPRVKTRSGVSRLLKRLEGPNVLLQLLAALGAAYVRLVRATSRVLYDPIDPFVAYRDDLPVVGTSWHGTLIPLAARPAPPGVPVRILVSNHRDGEVAARVAEKLGYGTVRGSGGRNTRWVDKGALAGFLGLRASLDKGATVLLTAEAPRDGAQRAGLGSVVLARMTGRPLVGLGVAASRALVVDSWDKAVVPLPFGRIAIVATPLIRVPAGASDAVMEEKRRELQDALNAATERAFEIVGRRPG